MGLVCLRAHPTARILPLQSSLVQGTWGNSATRALASPDRSLCTEACDQGSPRPAVRCSKPPAALDSLQRFGRHEVCMRVRAKASLGAMARQPAWGLADRERAAPPLAHPCTQGTPPWPLQARTRTSTSCALEPPVPAAVSQHNMQAYPSATIPRRHRGAAEFRAREARRAPSAVHCIFSVPCRA